jgi:hypothetical protein
MKSISEIIQSALDQTKQSIIANHINAGQLTTGKTSGLFDIQNVSNTGGQLWGWQFMGVWETGRKPGKWPPRQPIQQWVEAKLGKTGSDAKSIAYLIQRKIGNEGSSLFRQGGRKDIFTPPIERLFNELPGQIGNELINIILKQ